LHVIQQWCIVSGMTTSPFIKGPPRPKVADVIGIFSKEMRRNAVMLPCVNCTLDTPDYEINETGICLTCEDYARDAE